MNEFLHYRYNPSYTPEPRFIPGYGGYLPGVKSRFGMTYGSTSHEVMIKQPEVAARLAHLEPYKYSNRKKDTVTLDCNCEKEVECQQERIIHVDEGKMGIPEYVCPGYMGCLTLKKKGVPIDECCDSVLRTLGCQQTRYDTCAERIEDPFPGPQQEYDFSKQRKRYKNGVWMRC